MDLQAYLSRIAYAGSTDPTYATLAGLVDAHTRAIPFENLDPLLGVPVTDLSAEGLTAKLVHTRRGGYCYEQNNLLRSVLVALGYEVDRLAGRVVWMDPEGLDGPPHAETHQTLAVRIPGVEGSYLVDVGFGGQTLTSPLRLVVDEIQQTDREPFRVRVCSVTAQKNYVLETLLGEAWQPLYIFRTEHRPLIDSRLGSWYVSTHPESIFVTGLSAAIISGDARCNLRGRNLTLHPRGGASERIRFDTAAQVCEALADRFGIDLTGLGDVEARVAQVLDS